MLKNQQKMPYFKDNYISFYLIVGANFPEARARRNSSPQPPPSVAPERILGSSAKLRQQFRSKWVRAKFRIRDQMKQVKFSEEVASRLRRSARPLCAKRKAANRHGSEKSIWTFRLRRRRFGCAKRTTNEICIQFFQRLNSIT